MNKKVFLKGGGWLLLWLLLVSMAFGSGNIKVEKSSGSPNCAILKADKFPLSNPYNAYKSGSLVFFNSSAVPSNPTDPGSPLVPTSVVDSAGEAEFYLNYDDTNVTLRFWDGATHYGYGNQGYPADKSGSGTVLRLGPSIAPSVQFLKSFMADHLKDTPYAPAIDIQEAQSRIKATSNTETTLTVNVAPDSGKSPDIVEIAGSAIGNYALKIVKDGDSSAITSASSGANVTGPTLINQSGSTFVIKGSYLVAGQKYKLTAWNRNWFTAADDSNAKTTSQDWTILSSTGVSASVTLTFSLYKSAKDKLVVNSISVPETLTVGSKVSTGRQLVEYINKKQPGLVSVLGKWDPVTGAAIGIKPIYDSSNAIKSWEGPDFLLVVGEGYQLYTNADYTLTLP